MKYVTIVASLLLALVLSNCSISGDLSGGTRIPSMSGPNKEARDAQIKAEPKGNYYVGRRYYVEKTRFWGYVRKPRQSWSKAQLVIFNEKSKRSPDRFSENGIGNQRYGFDTNYEYKLNGHFSGEKVYEPNSNQILPEFVLKGYEVLDKDPGWLFSPSDKYDPKRVTLRP